MREVFCLRWVAYGFGRAVMGRPEPEIGMRTSKKFSEDWCGGGDELLDVCDVAALLKCSTRHVYRLAHERKMPLPLRHGALVRWDRTVLQKWIGEGCPSARSTYECSAEVSSGQ